jgi:fumarate reductase flavoprotein subunit
MKLTQPPTQSLDDSAIDVIAQLPELQVPVIVVGAGACGLVAALAAADAGLDVWVLERDSIPRGSTAMSSGLIPAAGTRWQEAQAVSDSPELMAQDINGKNHHEADPTMVQWLADRSARTLHWLADRHAIAFSLVTGFLYPGHSVLRMHGTPARTGQELMGALTNAAESAGVNIVCDAQVTKLLVTPERSICGVQITRPDGSQESIGCQALVLASSGFGGHAELVAHHMPAMAGAVYYGHAGNQGDALRWGAALGAQMADLQAYQGHGSLAWPHQTLITWSVMMMGGVQVNVKGERFSNEHEGYSEQARRVLRQPESVAWNIFDARIHEAALAFEDYRQANAAGAVVTAPNVQALAMAIGVPHPALMHTMKRVDQWAEHEQADDFGREFVRDQRLEAPYYAIRVTGALFHTQGGLVVDTHARVLDTHGQPIDRLYAGGGAARGVSGSGDQGYLSGNGLLSAVMLGATAGEHAALRVMADCTDTSPNLPSV